MERNKILVLGSKGMLGGQLMEVFGSEAVGWDRSEADVMQVESLKLKVESLKPSIIINCVAYNDVDGAEDNRELAFLLNSQVPKNLSEIANACTSTLVHFSTNYVFDGEKGEYGETDGAHPLSVYGQSKAEGEKQIIISCKKYYIIRTAVLFGPKGQSELSKKSFVNLMLELSQKTDTIKAVSTEVNSITYTKDLAQMVKVLLFQNSPYGIYHLTNSGQASWYDYAKEIFAITKKSINLIPVSRSEFPRKAKTPQKAVLINTKLPNLRPWQEALREFLTTS